MKSPASSGARPRSWACSRCGGETISQLHLGLTGDRSVWGSLYRAIFTHIWCPSSSVWGVAKGFFGHRLHFFWPLEPNPCVKSGSTVVPVWGWWQCHGFQLTSNLAYVGAKYIWEAELQICSNCSTTSDSAFFRGADGTNCSKNQVPGTAGNLIFIRGTQWHAFFYTNVCSSAMVARKLRVTTEPPHVPICSPLASSYFFSPHLLFTLISLCICQSCTTCCCNLLEHARTFWRVADYKLTKLYFAKCPWRYVWWVELCPHKRCWSPNP